MSSRLARSTIALRISLVALVVTSAAMPFAPNTIGWFGMRAVAGFASAVVFVIAVNSMLDRFAGHAPHLPGWGFGGVGLGIALSGGLVLALPTARWQSEWWMAAVSAAVLTACAWGMPKPAEPQPDAHLPAQLLGLLHHRARPGSSAPPPAVNVTERRSRSKRLTLRSRSSALICWDSDGPAMCNRSAARPKFSSSATARK